MTVSSEVDLCNLTLDLLNQAPITSIEIPKTSTEETCARWYDQTRRQALRRHPWNFAVKRVILAPNATTPPFGWQKAFDLPTDYIRLKHLNESIIVRDSPVAASLYSVEANQILIGDISGVSDTTQLRLVYISDFKTVTRFDPSFIDYFVVLMAKNISYKFTQSNSTIERTDKLMDKAEKVARAINGQENPPKRVERSRNRGVRRNSGRARNLDGTIVF